MSDRPNFSSRPLRPSKLITTPVQTSLLGHPVRPSKLSITVVQIVPSPSVKTLLVCHYVRPVSPISARPNFSSRPLRPSRTPLLDHYVRLYFSSKSLHSSKLFTTFVRTL